MSRFDRFYYYKKDLQVICEIIKSLKSLLYLDSRLRRDFIIGIQYDG